MTANYLEQLAAEWYEYSGYFVRRNLLVGPKTGGGFESELAILAVHVGRREAVHIEPSMDAHSWEKREERYRKRFEAGRTYVPELLEGLELTAPVRQIALIGLGSRTNHPTLGGGEVLTLADFMTEILSELKDSGGRQGPVPQQYPILRTLQFIAEHRRAVITSLIEADPRQISF